MKKLLVPTDFSDNAMKATLYAAEIATKKRATLYLLHAVEPVVTNTREPFLFYENYLEEYSGDRLKELDAVREAVATSYPDIEIEVELSMGAVITSIIDFATLQQVDLIVMGTHGANGLKEILIGSIAAGTIGRTNIPVLAIPAAYEVTVPDVVLFATNQFEHNREHLNKIIDVAALFSAAIHVVVFADTDTTDTCDFMYYTRQLNYYMDFLTKTYPGVSFKGKVLEGSDFEDTIAKYNNMNEVDIVAMMTYPKSFWEKLINKSATKGLASHSKIPVLAIPVK